MLLEVEDLHVNIRTRDGAIAAVRGVSLSVDRNEVHCLVGESGCGKSVTIMAVMGLLPETAKRSAKALRFDAEDLNSLDEADMRRLRGHRMSVIFQDPMTSLNPSFTIGTQLADVLLQHERVGRRAALDRAEYLLSRVGIRDPLARLRQYPHEMSGGLRQRVMIAMALMCQPKLLLADEPTTALDVTIQREVLALLGELKAEFGLGLMLVTHDFGVVYSIADRVSVMYAGEIVESGPTADVLATPLHPYTRGLIHCLPEPGRTPRQSPLYVIPGSVTAADAAVRQCGFAERCSHVHDGCRGQAIALRDFGPRHRYRCNLEPRLLRETTAPETER